MKFSGLITVLLAVAVSAFAGVAPHNEDHTTRSVEVERRLTYYHGMGTYYYPDVEVGACGIQYYSSDQVVALPEALWNNGAQCGQWITIWATADSSNVGVSQGAIVGDLCPTCDGEYSIDMSPKLFELFADLDQGVVPVEYIFQ